MTHQPFPISWVREQFPALRLTIDSRAAVFLDGPGGTQVPARVIQAVSDYYRHNNSNLGGQFLLSRRTGELVEHARKSMAEFLNARQPEEIVFGPNMTTLTFGLSRALAKTWEPGDEIVVTSLDHDANITPWRLAANERGVTVKTWEVRPQTCTLSIADLSELVTERTRLVAVCLASNATGSRLNAAEAVRVAHSAGAKIFMDAVHSAPHAPIDVRALNCDFLACSVYKFFGPHLGVLWGRHVLLEQMESYRVRPAPARPPGKWETGTENFEGIAGALASLEYLQQLAAHAGGGRDLRSAMSAIETYEAGLSRHFLDGLRGLPRVRLFGLAGLEQATGRTPTFAIRVDGQSPEDTARHLGDRGVFVWNGHFYAVDLMNRLGLENSGGVVRIGFVHYNTEEEAERVLEELAFCCR
jgi:cysteine desulfurase family protein (TIGR01976 family)